MSETRVFLQLGYPGVAAYAGARFCLGRSEAFEYVRVGTALLELDLLRDAFAAGTISWRLIKAITRVSSVADQDAWLDFARRHPAERTLAEVRVARRHGRSAPRGDDYGLPNLDQRLVLRLSMSEMHRLRLWLDRVAKQVGERTGKEDVSLEEALMFVRERDLAASASASASAGGVAAGEPADKVDRRGGGERRDVLLVYQACPGCRRSRLRTEEGFVEVDRAEVERVEGVAERVAIDGPTPRAVRRRVLGRDAGRCSNPRCGHAADHCHHIVFRRDGGRSALFNETSVCRTCHALIHAGLLTVTGRADGELRWRPIGEREGGLSEKVRANGDRARRLPVLTLLRPAVECGAGASADADGQREIDAAALAQGLVRLGEAPRRARRRVERAIAGLDPAGLTEQSVLRAALANPG